MALKLNDAGRRMLGPGAERVQVTIDRLDEALSQPGDSEADFDDFLALGAPWYYVRADLLHLKDTTDLTELHRQAQLLSGLLTSDDESGT